jgi:hypothetical protein
MAKGVSRNKRREARWRRIIREHGRSGLTIREFCRRGKLTETAFYFWRSELHRREVERPKGEQEQRKRPSAQATFVPVTVARDIATQAHGRMEIELHGGHRVHVVAPVDRRALADVLLAVSDAERTVLLAPSDVEGPLDVTLDREGRPC